MSQGKVGPVFLLHVQVEREEDRLWGRVCLVTSCCCRRKGTRNPSQLQGRRSVRALSYRAE